MASYRPFLPPPQSSFGAPPNQNPLPPPPPPQPQGNQYSQSWGYNGGDGSSYSQNYSQMHPNSNFQHGGYAPSSSQYGQPSRNPIPPPPPPHHQQQQQQYPYPPPPPPPPQESSYPPPPPPQESSYPPPLPPSMSQSSMNLTRPAAPPASMYYPSSQYSQFNNQQLQPLQPPPPPPPSSPPSSSIPPPPPPQSPPPPSSVPTIGQIKRSRPDGEKGLSKDVIGSGWGDPGQSNPGAASKQHKPPAPEFPLKKSNGPLGRIETEEERRLRKKRELDKQRQEEKYRQQLKESQNTVLQKTQLLSSGMKGHGSISGSRMGERRTTPLLSGERTENRLKKPTTFLCKLK